MAFNEIQPFGEEMVDMRHGILTSVLANVNRDAKKKPEPYKATDFIYWHEVHRAAASKAQDAVLLGDPEEQSKLLIASLFGEKRGPVPPAGSK